jgi:hypothetical protein
MVLSNQERHIMQQKMHIINLEFALRSGREGRIEFWRNNGDGTCTRIADGLTLTHARYDELPGKPQLSLRRYADRLRWDD